MDECEFCHEDSNMCDECEGCTECGTCYCDDEDFYDPDENITIEQDGYA
jgi:hypothetical protein